MSVVAMKKTMKLLLLSAIAVAVAHPMNAEAALARQEELAASAVAPGSCSYPVNCAGKVLPRPDTQSWQMNKSTIIMCATPKGSSAITRAEA